MSNDPMSKYAQGYATGVPTVGAGGMPDPHSMAGVHDREARERREREARANAQTAVPQYVGPEMVLLTHPHRVSKPFVKADLIHYQFSCFNDYARLAERKRQDRKLASELEAAGFSEEDKKIMNSPEYQEYVQKGLDLAQLVSYGVRRHEAHNAVSYTPFLQQLQVFDEYTTWAIADPSNYDAYLKAFFDFNNKFDKDDIPSKTDPIYYGQTHFKSAHQTHREISYLDHIELRKKTSINSFKKFMADMGAKDQKARSKKRIRNVSIIGFLGIAVALILVAMAG